MAKDGKQSYYEILDVSLNAGPEVIRTAYIRAKNAYNRDSLASYSLFDQDESKRIVEEIEEAYTVLSDSEKRRKYDESHGILSSESVYDSYHRGNHAVAAFTRDTNEQQSSQSDRFGFEDDPFRKAITAQQNARAANTASPAAASSAPSPIDRLKALQNVGQNVSSAKNYHVTREYAPDDQMEEKIKKAENISGSFLRSVREYKKVSPDEIIDILKISKNYLSALEEDDVGRLPANVFVRGFVIQYAKALKLDHDKIAGAYMEFLRSRRPS
jgi:curved DNA-binding protein CbpA